MKGWTYEDGDTAKLGKPFIPMKTLDDQLCLEDGQWTHKGKIRVYIDPRGDGEFAIGLHPWMAGLLGGGSKRKWDKSEFNIKTDKAGHQYILAPTMKEVVGTFRDLQRRYSERLEVVDGKEYIAIYYICEAPAFNSIGQELPEDDSINLGDKPRRRSRHVELRLDYAFGVLVEPAPGETERRFYELREDKSITTVGRTWRSENTQTVYLPKTDENIAQLQLLRRTLARAAEMFHELFKLSPDEFLARLGAAPLVPSLPAPEKPAIKTLRRTRR